MDTPNRTNVLGGAPIAVSTIAAASHVLTVKFQSWTATDRFDTF